MSWKDQIPACFDYSFANHPSDEEKAFTLLVTLREERVGWKEVLGAIHGHLLSTRLENPYYIQVELAKVERLFRPWLLD